MSFAKEVWLNLASIDVSQHIEKKGNLSYLSWSEALSILMSTYPESTWSFDDVVYFADGTAEIWCNVTVREGDKQLCRRMWLPIMDHRNNAVIGANARQINDTRMRLLAKTLAMFGLGISVYKGEDLPDPKVVEMKAQEEYRAIVEGHRASIEAIKQGIADGELSSAAEAWFELDEDTKRALWKAPTKGGVFTTQEREVIKTTEFREAFYGSDEDAA